MKQVHDLADAGTAHVAQLGQGRVVGDLAGTKVLVETQRQRHQARDAWNATRGRARLLDACIDRATRTVATADDVKVHVAIEGHAHTPSLREWANSVASVLIPAG